jgi:hypothetical protein
MKWWSCAFVAVMLASLGRAAAGIVSGPVVAESDFNTAAGYTIGQTVHQRGAGDPGWGGNLWQVAADGAAGSGQDAATVDGVNTWEGDGSLHVAIRSGITEQWVHRSLAVPLTTPFWIEQYVRLPANAIFQSRPGLGGTGNLVAAHWMVRDGKFWVMDGNGTGSGTFEDTGLAFHALQWQKVSLLVNPGTKSYEFYVDDQKYNAPDPLNFRGNPQVAGQSAVQFLDYLSQGEGWVDRVRISSVPEPSTLVLLGAGGLGLLACVWRRARRDSCTV